MKMLEYESLGRYREVVVASKVVRLSKDPEDRGERCRIHLDNGEVVYSRDSLRTLESRMDLIEDAP